MPSLYILKFSIIFPFGKKKKFSLLKKKNTKREKEKKKTSDELPKREIRSDIVVTGSMII